MSEKEDQNPAALDKGGDDGAGPPLIMDRAAGYDDVLTDPGIIKKHIAQALLEESVVELQIGERVEIFYTYFRDLLPDSDEDRDDQGDVVASGSPSLGPFKYLDAMDQFLLDLVEPEAGNDLIRSTPDRVKIRFFKDVNALEANVTYLEDRNQGGERVLRFAWPEAMGIVKKRRHYRVKILPEMEVTVAVGHKRFGQFQPNVQDISSSGLAFCHAIDPKVIPEGERILVGLQRPDESPFQFFALVKHHIKATLKSNCKFNQETPDVTITGVQFTIPDFALVAKVDELVVGLQLQYLAALDAKEAFLGSGDDAETEVGELKKIQRRKGALESLFDRGGKAKKKLSSMDEFMEAKRSKS